MREFMDIQMPLSSKRLFTYFTDIRLLSTVRANVCFECSFLDECLVTSFTLEIPLFGVGPNVRLEIRFVFERPIARLAHKWLLPSVGDEVHSEAVPPMKRLLASPADMGLFSCVREGMRFEIPLSGERLVARVTNVPLADVSVEMLLKIGLVGKPLVALEAAVRFFAGVGTDVDVEVFFSVERLAARSADVRFLSSVNDKVLF